MQDQLKEITCMNTCMCSYTCAYSQEIVFVWACTNVYVQACIYMLFCMCMNVYISMGTNSRLQYFSSEQCPTLV